MYCIELCVCVCKGHGSSTKILRFTELVWCNETFEILSESVSPVTGPLGWLSFTRQDQSSTEVCLVHRECRPVGVDTSLVVMMAPLLLTTMMGEVLLLGRAAEEGLGRILLGCICWVMIFTPTQRKLHAQISSFNTGSHMQNHKYRQGTHPSKNSKFH